MNAVEQGRPGIRHRKRGNPPFGNPSAVTICILGGMQNPSIATAQAFVEFSNLTLTFASTSLAATHFGTQAINGVVLRCEKAVGPRVERLQGLGSGVTGVHHGVPQARRWFYFDATLSTGRWFAGDNLSSMACSCAGSTGLVRWNANPASAARCLSSS